jgi:hypothetical protein
MSEQLASVCIVGITVVAFVILGLTIILIGGKLQARTKHSCIEIESAKIETGGPAPIE